MNILPTALLCVVAALAAYLAFRRPDLLVCAYLVAAPCDAYQLPVGGVLLSAADVLLAWLFFAAVIWRPRTLWVAPRWYVVGLSTLCLAVLISVASNYQAADFGAARAFLAKVVASYCVACLLISEGSAWSAVTALSLGIAISTAFGLFQEAVYLRSGWEAVLDVLPRVLSPDGIAGQGVDAAASRGDLGFAVVGPSRGFTPFPMRMPGGTVHAALLGLLATFPLSLGVAHVYCRRRPLWIGCALIALGIVAFWVTEGRSVIVGVIACVGWLLSRDLFRSLSPGRAASLMVVLALLTLVIVKLGTQDLGLRRDAFLDVISNPGRFIVGMGPGEYESHSSVGINVHSTPLQLFTDLGLIGFLAYLRVLSGVVARLWRQAHRQDVFILGAAFIGYLTPAIVFHPSAGTREHWVLMALAAAGTCRLPARAAAREPVHAAYQSWAQGLGASGST